MYDIVIVALVSFTHDRKIIGNDSLLRTIKTAKETLARVEQQEKDFYQLCGQCESDVLRNIILVQQREIYMKEKCLKRFDRCVDNVNNHLKVMEGEALAAISASCISETSTGTHNSSVKRNKDDKLADDSSPTTDLPVDVSQQIAEIGEELNKLEEQVDGIEIRVKDDLEAEQIDITFPITEIIDCMTALKVTMFKRHSLTKQLHNIVLSNNKFVEEAKIMKKGYAIWTKEEREDLLNKLALLEKSLAHLEQFPLIRNNEFSRYYPLTNDLAILKRTIVRFLDKFEMANTLPTAKLVPSMSLSGTTTRFCAKVTEKIKEKSKEKHLVHGTVKNAVSATTTKSKTAPVKFFDNGTANKEPELQRAHEYRSEVDLRTAVEKASCEQMLPRLL